MNNNLTQQNIPKGWTLAKVGDIGSTYSGLRSKNKSDFGYGSPFITYMNIFSNSKIDKNRFDLVNVAVDENQSKVKYGDVFFTVSSETPEEVGMSSVLLDDVDNYYLNSFCFGFRLNDFDSLTPQYARYLFRGNDFRSKIVKMAQGSTRFNLSKERVLSLDITLPPVKEQQKIAEILGTVDEDITKTQGVIEATEKLKRGLMQQLFTRGIGHTKFKETKIGQIPEEWEVLELGKVCDVRDGTHSSPKYHDEGIPLITSKNLVDTKLDFDNVSLISKTDFQEIERRSKVDDGDILFGMIGTIGNPVIVKKDRDFAIKNVALIKFTNSKLNNVFVLNFLKSEHTESQFNQKKGGSTQKFIALGVIRQVLITVPSVTEQKEIADIFSVVDDKISVNKKLKEKLTLLKKGLMQDLLSGKVRTINN